jgi:hypothetical protein
MAEYHQINLKAPRPLYLRWRRALGQSTGVGFLAQLLDHWENPETWRHEAPEAGVTYAEGRAAGRQEGRVLGHLEVALALDRPEWVDWVAVHAWSRENPLGWAAVQLSLAAGPQAARWRQWQAADALLRDPTAQTTPR